MESKSCFKRSRQGSKSVAPPRHLFPGGREAPIRGPGALLSDVEDALIREGGAFNRVFRRHGKNGTSPGASVTCRAPSKRGRLPAPTSARRRPAPRGNGAGMPDGAAAVQRRSLRPVPMRAIALLVAVLCAASALLALGGAPASATAPAEATEIYIASTSEYAIAFKVEANHRLRPRGRRGLLLRQHRTGGKPGSDGDRPGRGAAADARERVGPHRAPDGSRRLRPPADRRRGDPQRRKTGRRLQLRHHRRGRPLSDRELFRQRRDQGLVRSRPLGPRRQSFGDAGRLRCDALLLRGQPEDRSPLRQRRSSRRHPRCRRLPVSDPGVEEHARRSLFGDETVGNKLGEGGRFHRGSTYGPSQDVAWQEFMRMDGDVTAGRSPGPTAAKRSCTR